MATQAPQERLARAHQQQQSNLAAAISRLAATLWRLNVKAPGVGTDAFLAAIAPPMRIQYARSSNLARAYYLQSRKMALPRDVGWTSPSIDTLEEGAIRSTLIGSGMVDLSERLDRDEGLAEALNKAGGLTAQAAVRLTLSGGRSYIQKTAERDPKSVAYAWMTRDDGEAPCYWCAMLESRGPVYTRESWPIDDERPGGLLKVHAHQDCMCHLSMVWSRGQKLPERTVSLYDDWLRVDRDFRREMAAAGKKIEPGDIMKNWRRWYDRERRLEAAASSAA